MWMYVYSVENVLKYGEVLLVVDEFKFWGFLTFDVK